MKWLASLVSLSLAVNDATASPVVHPRNDLQVYKLLVASNDSPELDGQEIKLNASTLGVYTGENYVSVQVYPSKGAKDGLFSLHTYPIGIVDHAVGIINGPGLYDFVDITQPAGTTTSNGSSWETFRMTDNRITNDCAGQWLAFPGADSSWVLKWSDDTVMTTENYMPVEVVYSTLKD